ncbi:MAG: hypothetical protein ACLQBB_12835 [Solirubrobacteraceae bacterium]
MSAAGTPASSEFLLRPDISDPVCNGGHGIRLSNPFGSGEEEIPTVASATIAGSSTLIAFSSYSPGKSFTVLESLTGRCEPEPLFGGDGAAEITIPSSLAPAHPPAHGPEGLVVDAGAASTGGGAIIAGSYAGSWMVGEVTGQGQPDPSFAHGGWSVLPFEGEVTAVLQEPSGRIILAGNHDASGCCTTNWAAALSARGRLEPTFGTHGRAELPTGEDSGIQRLALEPGGEILADVGHGNMGCWGTSLAMLTASGQPVAGFAARLARFWHRLGLHAFVGDVYVDRGGFTLAGTGQKPCYDQPPGSTATATGLLARFRVSGEPSGPTIRFTSRMYGTVKAFHASGDTFLVEFPYFDRTPVTITALHPDGSLDRRFASRGRAEIRLPQGNGELPPTLEAFEVGDGEIGLLATPSPGSQRPELRLIRLRL